METKYYIPELEEFHIEFEYEMAGIDNYWNITSWKKEIVNEKFDYNLAKEYPNLYRVKYLDREDIESLGWTLDQCVDGDYFFIIGNMIKGDLMLSTSNFIDIQIVPIIGSKNKNNFEGQIKNKSELKKLMKQLQIWEQ